MYRFRLYILLQALVCLQDICFELPAPYYTIITRLFHNSGTAIFPITNIYAAAV